MFFTRRQLTVHTRVIWHSVHAPCRTQLGDRQHRSCTYSLESQAFLR